MRLSMKKELPLAPDFDLGPLLTLPNDFLKSSDPKKRAANALILSLACVFNDLKGILWFVEQHIKYRQPDEAATAYNGQMQALNIQIQRLIVGTIHELTEILRKSKIEMTHPDIQTAVKKLSKSHAASWAMMISITKNENRGTEVKGPSMANFLRIVRNTTAFHYDNDYIMNGYEEWLKQASKNPNAANKFAYVSLGKNAEETRFFFADAPTTLLFDSELSNRGFNTKELKKVISAVNQALRFVIEHYIFPNGRK